MTQLQLGLEVDRPDAHIAAITYRVLYEADHLRARPPAEDAANAAARVHLLRGADLLLDWLARQSTLPDEPLAWPCSACFAAPGEPCDVSQRVDRWTGPLPHYHLARGTGGRWADICRPRAAS